MSEPRGSRISSTAIAYMSIIVAVFLWGGSFAAMRGAIARIGAFSVMSLRSLLAAAVLIPFIPALLKMLRRSYRRGDAGLLFVSVLMQPCLYFLFESNALRFTSAAQAGMVSAVVPILTAFGAWLFLKEEVEPRMTVGILLAVGGIVLVTLADRGGTGADRPVLGNTLEFLAMICAAGNLVAVRGLSRRFNTWLLTALQVFAGALFFLPGIRPLLNGTLILRNVPWTPVLYLGVGSSLGAFGLYNWGMGRIPAARASSFINLIPVIAAAGAWLVLDERLTLLQILGGAIVLVGVVISQKPKDALRLAV